VQLRDDFNTRIEAAIYATGEKQLADADYVFVAIMVGGGRFGLIDRENHR